MSKYFGFIVIAVSLVALAVNATLFLRIGAAEKAIKKIESLRIALPKELHFRIEKNLREASNRVEEQMKGMTAQFQKSLNTREKQYGKALDNQAKLIKNQSEGIKAAITQSEAFIQSLKLGQKQQQEALAKHIQRHQDALQKQTETMLNRLKAVEKQHSAQLKAHLTVLQRGADKATLAIFKKIQEDNKREMQKIAASVALLAKQKIAGNEAAAQEAFKTATALMKKRDYASARLYCLNAINHAPNKKQYFEALYRITDAKKTADISELEQLRSVLELGLYQVDSKDIPAMSKMLLGVIAKQEKISAESARIQAKSEKKKISDLLVSLQGGELSWQTMLKESPEEAVPLLRRRLNELTNLLTNDRVSGEKAEFCKNEIKKTNTLLEYYVAMFSIDNALNKAKDLLESGKATPAVNSMVQSANNILSQSWNIDFTYLPTKFSRKLLSQADRIAKLEKEFNIIKSRPAMAAIEEIYNNIELNGNCTQKINTLQEAIKKIMAEAAKVYDTDARSGIETKIEELSKKVKNYAKERYDGYQAWTVRKCRGAVRLYNSWRRVDEVDAIRVINEYLLEIDPALLTPSVSRLYQDVLSKQFAEMGWKKIAEMEQRLATYKKKTIEDCPNE